MHFNAFHTRMNESYKDLATIKTVISAILTSFSFELFPDALKDIIHN